MLVPFSAPWICEDVRTTPMLSAMRTAYENEGIVSMIVFPLTVHGERTATMVFYSRRTTSYRDVDAAALTNAELYEEQRRAREAADRGRQQSAFLAEAGTALSSSLDYETTLKSVARLAVPTIADWCAVDIVNERGVVQRLAVGARA